MVLTVLAVWLIFLLCLTTVLCISNRCFVFDLGPRSAIPGPSTISVALLIPARDEAVNLSTHLSTWLAQDYAHLEVHVLDDGSRDSTSDLLAEIASTSQKLQTHIGIDLPSGWNGKPWACQQLARTTHAEIVIFCDADVRVDVSAVRATIACMEHNRLDALTVITQQQKTTAFLGALSAWVMCALPLCFLPLCLQHRLKWPALTFGNGQWFAVRRRAYDMVGGHESVRGEATEDLALARALVRADFGVGVAFGHEKILARTYSSWNELARGFGKNFYWILGGTPLRFGVFLIVLTSLFALPWLLGGWMGALCLVWAIALLSIASEPALRSWTTGLWQPLIGCATLVLALNSAWRVATGRNTWKGRVLTNGRRD